MELERLERMRNSLDVINNIMSTENDSVAIHLRSNLNEFTKELDIAIKDKLYEDYQKERMIKQSTIKE